MCGQLISRWGRYKAFPIAGTAVMAFGLFMMSRMSAETTVLGTSLNMLLLGMGLGLVMQVLVIAVQNAIDYKDLGVATSGAILFRLIGGSIGTAVFGSLFASRLHAHLEQALPAGAPAGLEGGISRQAIEQLPDALRAIYVEAFTTSLSTVFLAACGVALLGFVLAWLVPNLTLREAVAAAAADVGAEAEGVFPLPVDSDPVSKIERALSLLATRDVKREYIQNVVKVAGLGLSPGAAWLLVRAESHPVTDLSAMARRYRVDQARLEVAAAELRERGLISERPGSGGRPPSRTPTERGREALRRLCDARRAHLAAVIADWAPEQRAQFSPRFLRLVEEIVPDGSAGA